MKVVITGGGGFIGAKLAKALLARGTLSDPDGAQQEISGLVLADQAFPDLPKDPRLHALAGDISDPAFAARAITQDTGAISTSPRWSRAPRKPTSTWACASTSAACARYSTRCAGA